MHLLKLSGIHVSHRWPAADHDAVEAVEVVLADGIELVVVAARAGDGKAQHGLADHVDLIVDPGDLLVVGVGHPKAVGNHAQLGGPDHGLIDLELIVEPWLFEKIAGELLADELVVGHVGVKRAD